MIVEEQTFEKENKDGEIGNENFENSKFSEVFHQKKLLVTSILVIKQTKAPKDQVIQNKLTAIFISYLLETVLKFLILLF